MELFGSVPNVEDQPMELCDPDLETASAAALAVHNPLGGDDGYSWRQYGQKMVNVKGSEFPRMYFRCTDLNCRAAKTVDRKLNGQHCETRYHGKHNHERQKIVVNDVTPVDDNDQDEPNPKRRTVRRTSGVDSPDDGYSWRKYGQKDILGSSHPRSYYRCTTKNCRARKQVGRADADPSTFIITYIGDHSHHGDDSVLSTGIITYKGVHSHDGDDSDLSSVITTASGDTSQQKPQEEGKNVNYELSDYIDLDRTLGHANVSATNEREPLGENLLPPETPEIVYGDHSGFEIKLTGMELSELPKAEEWEVSKLMHLNNSELFKLPENPRCPVLEDLSLKGNCKLKMIPPLFFDWMPSLHVLDLSRTRIKSLPDSLFSLTKLRRLFLRHCNLLMKLSPKVGQLKDLQVLDLEGTEIMHLPGEVKELKNLICLKVSFCELPSYRRVEEPDVLMISPWTLSALPLLEELSINASLDDGRWNECVEHVVFEVSGLLRLDKLQFYFPSVEFLSHFDWFRFRAFKLTAGHLTAKRLMPRLPSDAEAELERYDKCLTYVHGDFKSDDISSIVKHANALFLDRHKTVKTLSTSWFDNFKNLRCCVVGECNELQVLVSVEDRYLEDRYREYLAYLNPPLVSLEYLYLYYMKSLTSIWVGYVGPLRCLKSLTLRTCPMLSSIFTHTPYLVASFDSLQELIIDDCPAIINLVSGLQGTSSDSSGTAHYNFLPRLKRISLHYLPRLNDIFDLSLSPDLEWMSIYHCPNLKSLPIDTASNENLKTIMGERSWWESLEWQDTKQHSWDDVFEEQEFCY